MACKHVPVLQTEVYSRDRPKQEPPVCQVLGICGQGHFPRSVPEWCRAIPSNDPGPFWASPKLDPALTPGKADQG